MHHLVIPLGHRQEYEKLQNGGWKTQPKWESETKFGGRVLLRMLFRNPAVQLPQRKGGGTSNCALKDRAILPMNRKMRNLKPLAVVGDSKVWPQLLCPGEGERDE